MELLSHREVILKFIINCQIVFQIDTILYFHCQWMRVLVADRNKPIEGDKLICTSNKGGFLGKWYDLTGWQGKKVVGLPSWLALYSQ